MTRFLTVLAALAAIALLAGTAEAKQKKKNTPTEVTPGGVVAGTIKSISDDGKTITVQAPSTKKVTGATYDVKVTDKTKTEYPGIDNKDEQKLLVGYTVSVQLEDGSKDTAASIKASKEPPATPKKKKKKADK
ncbi:MAG TPA: hypothetical protein VGF55_31810 [Gemmataceae bacterium]